MERTPPELKTAARNLRTNATEAERRLWQGLRPVRPRFTRQLVVSHYILDIACRSLKLAVELDGGQHAISVKQDAVRTAYLEAQGWQVMRFWNNDVLTNLEAVVDSILQAAAARGATHPQPLPSREGSSRHCNRLSPP